MPWYSTSSRIPTEQSDFNRIIEGFVFQCPSCVMHKKKNQTGNGKKRTLIYKPVSVRFCSFRYRGITSSLLTTVLSLIRKPLAAQKTYSVLQSDRDIKNEVANIISTVELDDPYYDIMVYHSRDDMSDAEAIFYYIRNAFAHGSFEVISDHGKRIYLLQSDKDDTVKAQMRLKESTLERLLGISALSPADLRGKQQTKKRKTT